MYRERSPSVDTDSTDSFQRHEATISSVAMTQEAPARHLSSLISDNACAARLRGLIQPIKSTLGLPSRVANVRCKWHTMHMRWSPRHSCRETLRPCVFRLSDEAALMQNHLYKIMKAVASASAKMPAPRLELPRDMHKPDASNSIVTTPLRVTPRSFNACRTQCIVLLMQLKAILNADVCPRRIRPESARESKWLAIRHPLIMASVGLSAGLLGFSTISNYCWTTASSAAKEHRANMPPLTAPR